MSYQAEFTSTFERQAEWRRDKAEQHPGDAKRNLLAAKTLDALALQADRGDFDKELFGRYCDLAYEDDDTSTLVSVEGTVLLREVGFQTFPTTVDQFLEELLDRIERVS